MAAVRKLVNRLGYKRNEILLFMNDFRVPFANNCCGCDRVGQVNYRFTLLYLVKSIQHIQHRRRPSSRFRRQVRVPVGRIRDDVAQTKYAQAKL
jgi:hypothetical protein